MAGSVEGRMRKRDELEEMLQDVARCLGPAHVAGLVAHPEAVRSAPAAATLAAADREHRSGIETSARPALPAVDAAEARRRISARTREGAPETLLTPEELAARIGLKTPSRRAYRTVSMHAGDHDPGVGAQAQTAARYAHRHLFSPQ